MSDDALDSVFAALAHPARRALLREVLSADGAPSMTELAAATGISPQLLTKHAASLERAALISRSPSGREKTVHAHREPLEEALAWIEQTRAFWGDRLDALDDYIASLRPPSADDAR